MDLAIQGPAGVTATGEGLRRGRGRRREDEWVQWLAAESNEVLSVIDPAGSVSYVSPGAARLFGWEAQEVMGKPATYLYHPDDLRTLGAPPRPRERRRTLRLRCRHEDGDWRETASIVRPVINPTGGEGIDGIGMVIISRDVSQDLAARRKLRQREDALEEGRAALAARLATQDGLPSLRERLKEEFLQTISHELRTPLTAILGFSDLLAARGVSDEHPELDIIRKNGRHLLEMVDDMFVLARAEAGELRLEPRLVNVLDSAVRVAQMVRPTAEQKGLSLRLRLPGTVVAAADDVALDIILRHLLVNAVKFTDAGWVEVRADQSDMGVRVTVEDTGQGISPAVRDLVFAPFTQADQSMTRTHGGAGLGLALVRRLVELQGGELGLEPRRGGGSAFWFQLPGPET
ncbi:MAG: hypothetical protein QOK05_2888 [Chloroflexota bacterium]|nr:hypothetical protein [Chloroflexota bacterium]